MKKIKSNAVFYIILISLLARLLYFFRYHSIWWDSAVYFGMAKHIFSAGSLGLWEPIRPIVWPIILGIAWKFNLNTILVGRLLEFIFSLAIIYLCYLIAEHLFDKKTAIFSSLILSFSATFFFFGFRLHSSIPSLFFAMLSIYLLLKNKYIGSAIFAAISFLTRFPNGIILIPILFFIYAKNKKKFIIYIATFLVTALPYLIFNYLSYKNPFFPFIQASWIVRHAGIWLFKKPWWFYFTAIPKENLLYIFSLIPVYFLIKERKNPKKNNKLLFMFLLTILPFAYFTFLQHKELRFTIIFLPYIAILSGYGLTKMKFKYINIVFSVLLIFALFNVYKINTEEKPNWLDKEFFQYLKGKKAEGEILITHPLIAFWSPKKTTLIYYPIYNSTKAEFFTDYVKKNKNKISYIFLDTCLGGMICPLNDKNCEEKTKDFIATVNSLFNAIYYKEAGKCKYYIYENV